MAQHLTDTAAKEMHEAPIYQREDPCLDGYFSTAKNHLMFGARRLGPSGTIMDAMTRSFSPPPLNTALGKTLLDELGLTQQILLSNSPTYHDIRSGKYDPITISASDSCAEFSIIYRPFTMWTKDDDHTPYFVGVPVSENFPFGENFGPIRKSVSNERLAFEFKKLLMHFSN